MSLSVSVIIPLYNSEKYIAETIGSVLYQTYENWELIIVNDGSTDNSVKIISNFLTDKRIKVVTQINAGVSAARNKGAEIAQGKILAFLDADDIWEKKYLQKKIVALLNAGDNYGMVLCYEQDIDQNSQKQNSYCITNGKNVIRDVLSFLPLLSTSSGNVFIRSDVFVKTGGFNRELSNSADKMFIMQAALQTKFLIIKEVLLYYRIHPSGMHHNAKLMTADYIRLYKIADNINLFESDSFKRSCYTKMYLICAFTYLKQIKIFPFFYYVIKAFISSPNEFIKGGFIKNILRRAAFGLMKSIGVLRALLFINSATNKVPVLLFHRVSPEYDPIWPPLAPHEFESIIKSLSKYYSFVGVNELLTRPKKELKNTCVIMFDDGYLDFYIYALPIIKQYNIPVTMFLSANNIRKHETIWTSQVDFSIFNSSEEVLEIEVESEKYTFDLSSIEQKRNASEAIKKILMVLPSTLFEDRLNFIKKSLGYDSTLAPELMTYEQVNKIKDIVNFQSHTLTHKYLPFCSESEVVYEMQESKDCLEKQLNKPIEYLSYPIGGRNKRVVELAGNYYRAAFTTDEKMVDLNSVNSKKYLLQIPRFNIYYSNPNEVLLRINGLQHLL